MTGSALQFEWSALTELLPLCVKYAEQWRKEGTIDLKEAMSQIGQAFGIEDVDKFAVDQLRGALEKALGRSFGEEEARAIAAAFAKNYKPVMQAIIKFARGESESDQFIANLNGVFFENIGEIGGALQHALHIPDEVANALANNLGPLSTSVYCFAAAFKIYQEAANDAALAKERRIEAERLAQEAIAHLKAERETLNELVSTYLLDRLIPFDASLSAIDQAILDDDDDGYIRANAELWQIFGRESQYTTAQEFDDLMLSDETFKL